ncbi:hypothetical protein ANO14919_126120 [Xylariales sp. No.14919]|nr:hypothetical protein ANO14919_126120 [Xylariales sp. No.14919]
MEVGANLSAADRNGSLPLHRAVRRGKWETVEELCSRDSTGINTRDNYKSTPLHIACQLGWTRCVEVLLAHNAEVITDDNPDRSPIAIAVENGHFEVVRQLLQFDKGLIAHCGRPLIEAARRGSLETVKFLYEQGASLTFKGKFGQTALHKACIAQNKGLVDYLLSKDLDSDPIDDSKRTPLYYAAEKGNLYIVNALIARNANVNSLDRRQETALFKPAGKGHVEVVKRLLEAGTDATKLDKWDRTPLRFAAMYGHPDVVAVLLKKTAIKQNIPDWAGRTVLHNAAAWLRKGQEDVIDILFEYKAESGQIDAKRGMTALHAALLRVEGEPPPTAELIKRLIHYRVPIDSRDMYGRTALYLAVVTRHAEAVRLLLEARANTNDNSFHEAVRRRDGALVQMFLEIKPRINLSERDWEHQTPLHIAANNGDKDIVTQLLNADAPTQSLDQNHMTPLMCAQKQGNTEIIKLLMNKDPIPSGDYVSRVENGVWKRSLLHWLAAKGKDLSQVLLDRSTLNAQDIVGRTPLHLAVMSKSLDTVQQLVSAKVDTNIADDSSFTPLHYATESQETAILQAIVSAPGINIDETDRWNRAALYIAAHKGNSENVRILLDIGASFTPDYAQRTPLHVAIDEEHGETVDVLLRSKRAPDLIRARDAHNRSVLHLVSCRGRGGILKRILRLVDDTSFIDERDTSGQTALHLASKYGHFEVVKELLAAGAMAHILDNDLFLAAHFAAEAGYTAIVGVLLDAIPVNVDKCLSKWQQRRVSREDILGSAVLYALLIEEVLEQVECGWYLARPGLLEPDEWAHLTSKVKDDLMIWGWREHSFPGTTLMRAVMGGHPNVVRVILEKVPNMPLHARSYQYQDALQLAAGRGYHSIIEQFIDAGANVNHNVENHETSLHQAAQNGHEAVITLLLQAGANPSTSRMTDGATPLHLAAENGHSGVVRQLVRVTFINVTDDMRQTPLHRACLHNYKAAIEMLLDAEANPLAQDVNGKTPLAIMSGLGDNWLCLRMQEQATRYRLEERRE